MIERMHLMIVREVDRQGSLTKAAQSLFLTQSALSHSIRKLESLTGAKIWLREGRQLHLTQAGRHLLALANRVLPQLELAQTRLEQYARGERGTLRIGMECHPCYQWLLKIVSPYLQAWPDVDVDVIQKFQFGGLAALLSHDIDLLVTPDPLARPSLVFEPVFDYEQVLVTALDHPLAQKSYVVPEDLATQTLICYPVEQDRLDIFALFLQPAGIMPARFKTIETTDILLQMVAAGRGVTALPKWLVQEYAVKLPIAPVRLGEQGVQKQLFLGVRESDDDVDYLSAFIEAARASDRMILQ